MKSSPQYFHLADQNIFKLKLLNWAKRFNNFCFLDNNNYAFEKASFECTLAVGSGPAISLHAGSAFTDLKKFYNTNPTWLFGHFSYELKNETELLPMDQPSSIDFGPGSFFIPSVMVKVKDGMAFITSIHDEPAIVFAEIEKSTAQITPVVKTNVFIKSNTSHEEYIEIINKLIRHIHRGDCYEINYCQNFFADDASIDPVYIYKKLIDVSPTPFAALYKMGDKYCICASPERYLRKTGDTILSQPMKGTSRRLQDAAKDVKSREYLLNSTKEKSENVMVVDLVRNDLSKVCVEGSVKVDELFGVYSFPQVHQMISTISGKLKAGVHWTKAIKATFPMGSMTGAPKKRVMELISSYESVPRGLFSGSIGYIDPDGNFDFNVVIRSIFYDSKALKLSFYAGSGITFYSNAEDEYQECMLKAAAIINVLNS